MAYLLLLTSIFTVVAVPSTGFMSAAHADDNLAVAATDWAWWRGPTRDGVAHPGQNPPLAWSSEKNVLWKVPVPGRGHGSPTVVGDRIFLATADEAEEIQSLLCFDRETGAQLWKTDIHHGGFESVGRQGHTRASKASSTPASDGERVFINFINDNAVYMTALDFDGNQRWQQKVTDYTMHQGYGSSPTIYGPLVIVAADNKGGGAIVAYDRESGKEVWKQQRPELPNYASPILMKLDGKDQLVQVGCDRIASLDPLTGKKNWEVDGATTECVTSTVSDGEVVVTSGGYPSKHISVVKGDGSGETLWRNETMVYVPSMLIDEGHLYVVTDNGDAQCYELETGKLAWEEGLRAKFSASPVLVGENIYATSDDGVTTIFKATPSGFSRVAENTIEADEVQATPAICGGKIYMRVATGRGDARQEMLYCIGS